MRLPYRRVVLILHGWEGSGPEHWQSWLARELGAGAVRYPTLADPYRPDREEWLAALAPELAACGAPPVVLAHSLGCILWLHAVAAGLGRAERALLVAPPSAGAGFEEIASFFPAPLDVTLPRTRVVCSDADPYCPEGAVAAYAEPLGLPADVIAGGGHLNTDAGYGPWPAVLAWARGERADVG